MKKMKDEVYEKQIKKLEYTQKGITLVALVITIVIIVVLATVTINFAFGENGLIKKAEQARDFYANDTVYTEESMVNVESYLDEIISRSGSGTVGQTDGSFNEEKGVNTPKLASNMKLVVFDENSNTWKEDTTKEAYSYVDTSISGNTNKSEWANAEVIVEGITSYFVWIPRYAYKITYYTGEDKTEVSETPTAYGVIDVKFIKGTGKETVDGTPCKYASENPDATQEYVVHPAFTDEVDNGGWDSQLAGIWIGKYEASLANKADGTNIVTDDEETGNILLSDNNDKTLVTRPGYSSWRYMTIGNMYTNALVYDRNLESHMLKNSEWGAVAYLTESKYGRNGTEVGFNQNSSFITGGGTDIAYVDNADQSTTGNVYGIYDMRGGSWERVANYYNGSDVNTTNLNNASSFASVNGQSTKYVTAYTETNAITAYKYGDAIYETSGWHSDRADFVNSTDPFFNRGGDYGNTASIAAGVFSFANATGNVIYAESFRVAIAL